MSAATLSAEQESVRLRSLLDLQLLDTDPELEYDELVQLASTICGTPISLMTLVDTDRQWFKASLGLAVTETPRDVAFCAHAIQRPDLFIIENATEDDRFSANPLVTGDPNIRFYAGMPLEAGDGQRVGTLCVIDTVPRHLTEEQSKALEVLGRQVSARMQLRLRQRQLEETLTAREKISAELQASEQMFRTFMDNSPFISFIKDADGRFLYYSRQFAEQFGIEGDAWVGTSVSAHFPEEFARTYEENDAAVLRAGVGAILGETTNAGDGSTKYWQSHKFPCRDRDGRLVLGGISVDVTEERKREIQLQASRLELEESNAQLRMLSLTDALTGLRNRRAFEERLLEEFSLARRTKRTFCVVMLDIDHFKRVNDIHGHAAGDEVLRVVAMTIGRSARISDMAARFGGEEFALILQETNAAKAMLWARRLEDMLAKVEWQYGAITVSMGIAELFDDLDEVSQLVKQADEALYTAKRTGRARAVIYAAQATSE